MATCPKCGYKRHQEDECPKCGIVYEKYLNIINKEKTQAKRSYRKPLNNKDKIVVITLITFLALIIGISVYNLIVDKMRLQREEDLRKSEEAKIIDTFAVNSEEICAHLEALIDQGKFDLAKKEIKKFDIPILREAYPQIGSLKQRVYDKQMKNEPNPGFTTQATNADTKPSSLDLCVCAMLRTLKDENHNDERCDLCGKKGGLLDDVKRKFLCGRTYELHSKCAGVILDKCERY